MRGEVDIVDKIMSEFYVQIFKSLKINILISFFDFVADGGGVFLPCIKIIPSLKSGRFISDSSGPYYVSLSDLQFLCRSCGIA